MKYKSPVYSEASGSIAGIVYSHNLGGLYTRARAIPTNPNTPYQAVIRALVAQLSNRWVTTLTEPQRQAWKTYADAVKLPDALGELRVIPPLAHYCRSNVPRILGNFGRVDAAPTIFDLGQFTAPVITIVDAATDRVTFTLTVSDEWNVPGGGLILYTSRPQNVTINYFKGPYRFATSIEGPAGTPQTKDLAFPCTAGQRVFFEFRFTQADGRLALPYRTFHLST